MVAAAPVTVVTISAVTVAWLRGWPPAQLRRAAAWSAPMTAAYRPGCHYQVAPGRVRRPVPRVAGRVDAFSLGNTLAAFTLCAPAAVPAGLLIASWAWGARIYRIETGLAGSNATAPVIFDQRQWTRQACLLAVRNQRILAAWDTRQAGTARRAALGQPPRTLKRRRKTLASLAAGPP